MKNAILYIFFTSIFCFSCVEEQGIPPSISIDSIYVNYERWDIYPSNLISRNSVIEVFTTLRDNEGGGLYTFNVESNCEIEPKELEDENSFLDDIEINPPKITIDNIEEDINPEMSYGSTLVFNDDVSETKVIVKTEVSALEDEEIQFQLLLNLNTKDAGSLEKIIFKFEKELPEDLKSPN